MNRLLLTAISVVLILLFISCNRSSRSGTGAFNPELKGFQVAFMADVHLQDVYGEFEDTGYKGVKNPKNGEYVTIRTMEAQLHSTRIFNENYFAFLAALDDVVKRGIKYVVLPGDFSDDGQPVNIRGLKRILDEYTEKYNITFLSTTGNHDPVRPFSMDAGKEDFLGEGGRRQPIMSSEGMYVPDTLREHPVIITRDIRKLGYDEIITRLDNFGFFPHEEYLYWETPFSTYNEKTYSYKKATEAAKLTNRNYQVSSKQILLPDVSYLAELEEGLWFLAIDANVYIPKKKAVKSPGKAESYNSPSIGYNNVLTHKKHLIKWVKEVTQRAERLGKTLIVFSHYPMVEFNDDATEHIRCLMGDNAMQLHRVPGEEVAKVFADAGIKLHFGGHMHINDTGIRKTKKGNTIINVQIPSLAAYIPAYKLLTIKGHNRMEVETIVIDSVPEFNKFFNLYESEHEFLQSIQAENIWSKDILHAKTYKEFTSCHLKELLRLRFLPGEWPLELKEFLLEKTGRQLFIISNMEDEGYWKKTGATEIGNIEQAGSWKKAEEQAIQQAVNNNLELHSFDEWNGFDLIFDFYRLRNADKLAISDIGTERLKQYQLVVSSLLKDTNVREHNTIKHNLKELAIIFEKFMNGAPAGHFVINTETGEVESVK